MIRYLAVLGIFLYSALWFLGADHGQYIHPPKPEAPVTVAKATARPVFIPAQPVPGAVEVPELQPEEASLALADPALPDPAADPAQPARKIMHVPGGATVRAGPGREFGPVGSLAAGDVVTVVDETSSPYWVKIRVDGRGEGWVAAKLLRE